jgi:putative FmdB family regulatory protein
MPTYDFHCEGCDLFFEEDAPVGVWVAECPSCQDSAKRRAGMPGVSFTGSGWSSKQIRMSRQMAEKNARLDKGMNERRGDGEVPVVVPNVGGERVDSWKEAQKLAASKGLRAETYEPLVYKERGGK